MSNKLRSFITTSTRVIDKKFDWNFDIESIDKYLFSFQSFPHLNEFDNKMFGGNVLLIKCNEENSKYINNNDLEGKIIIIFMYLL